MKSMRVLPGLLVCFACSGGEGTPFDPFFDAPEAFFGGENAHNFDPSGGLDRFQNITVSEGAGFTMVLQWDSPFFSASGGTGTLNDLDVYIVRADTGDEQQIA